MAKRSRLTAKPGQRRPLQRTAPSVDRPRPGVTDAELARAAELEAAIVAEEKAADAARLGRTRRASATGTDGDAGVVVARPGYSPAPLSVRAADEYAYVKRDIRRITIVGGFLIAILAVLDVLVNGMKLFTL